MEARALDEIVGSLPSGARYKDLWQEYGAGVSLESRLVHDADVLELLVQAHIYERSGHRDLAEFWDGRSEDDFNFLETKRLFRELKGLRDDLKG
jgi:putative hydrolase of HD superfamily